MSGVPLQVAHPDGGGREHRVPVDLVEDEKDQDGHDRVGRFHEVDDGAVGMLVPAGRHASR
jgi:hypothetical protein